MAKRKMIIADQDEQYLSNISNYFLERLPQWELGLFTRKEKLSEYLGKNRDVDILAVDENLIDQEVEAHSKGTVRIALSGTMTPIEGFELVQKYQKTENMLREILRKHSEGTGSIEAIQGNSQTKVAVFYSPVGGSGKTTLSLAMAAAGAKKEKRLLYINMEEIDSVKDVLPPVSGGLSDVFLALKTKGMNVGVKLESCVAREGNSGFFYLPGVESISEYEEITGDDMKKLIQAVCGLSKYDLVVIDLSSGFSERVKATLESADIIFMPVVSTESAAAKVNRLFDEENIHEGYHSILSRLNMIINQSDLSNIGREIIESNLLARVPCNSVIASSPVFARRTDILRSGEAFWPILEPLFQLIDHA